MQVAEADDLSYVGTNFSSDSAALSNFNQYVRSLCRVEDNELWHSSLDILLEHWIEKLGK